MLMVAGLFFCGYYVFSGFSGHNASAEIARSCTFDRATKRFLYTNTELLV